MQTARSAGYRPKPRDFRAVFIELGWGVKDHYGARCTIILRWLQEEGREQLLAERARHLRNRRAKNYVMGRRRSS